MKRSNRQNKTLTILICCYNAEEFLKDCLESFSRQNFASSFYSVMLVNDASTDRSLEIAGSYTNILDNLTLINNKENEGLVRCCNKAIDEIKSPYFMRLDSDDYLSSDAVEKIREELNRSSKADFIVFNRWDVWDNRPKEVESGHDIYTWISAGTVFKTEALKSVGGYSDEYWEEYDLYIKLLGMGYKYRISPYRIYYYRRNPGSMTGKNENNTKGFQDLLDKWGEDVLAGYGDFRNMLKYYSQRN